MNSATATAGADALASEYNNLRKDLVAMAGDYTTTAGTSTAYTLTVDSQWSLVAGCKVKAKLHTSCGLSPTMNVNGGGAVSMKSISGDSFGENDLPSGMIAELVYTGTVWQVTNFKISHAKKESYTASGAIDKYDSVYISAANTVKKIYPSAQGTGASITTAPAYTGARKPLPLSLNGKYLDVVGGTVDYSGVIYAQVRSINSTETDFSTLTTATIYSTGAGSRHFDVKSIGTDKFLFIFQAATSAPAAAGIKCCVVTVTDNGTTINVGAITTIETTGNLSSQNACAKVDTDKAAIFYRRDSDGHPVVQILTVSGTTITTNTPVSIKSTTNQDYFSADQLATNSVVCAYGESTTNNIFGITISISGTTPTLGAEQTLVSLIGNFRILIRTITSTKALLIYNEASGTNDNIALLSISGATITNTGNITLSSARSTIYFGCHVISSNYALVADFSSSTQIVLFLFDISGTTPSLVSSQNLSCSADGLFGVGIAKVRPWTYIIIAQNNDSDYIVKLTPASSAIIGVAESAISDTATGNIFIRYGSQNGFTGLSAGSTYYIDDNAQPTANSSLTAPVLGFAISTTKMMLQ